MDTPASPRLTASITRLPAKRKTGCCDVKHCRNRRRGKSFMCSKHIMQEWRANNPVTSILNTIRDRARRRGIPFSLSLQEFKEFCATNGYNSRQHHIDRDDPTDGYHLHNIVVLGASANIAKGNRERHSPRYQAYLASRKADSRRQADNLRQAHEEAAERPY